MLPPVQVAWGSLFLFSSCNGAFTRRGWPQLVIPRNDKFTGASTEKQLARKISTDVFSRRTSHH